jgi:hypothetical protein
MIIIGVAFIAGLTIGGGCVMMFINQRKIPLDKWTESFKVNKDDLASGEKLPIRIVDTEYGDNVICEVTMLEYDQNERVNTAQWVEDALNRHRG